MSGATRVLWLSRHAPLPSQLRELRRLYGQDVAVTRDPEPFSSAVEAAAGDILARTAGYDETVLVAPLALTARLLAQGLRPLRAEMLVCSAEVAETTVPGDPPRHYRFDRFVRLVKVEVVTEEVGRADRPG